MKIMSSTVDKYTDKKEVKLIFPFFISTIAELMCLVPYLPVDTVRTRIQVQDRSIQDASPLILV